MCGLDYLSTGQHWSRERISKEPAPTTKSWKTKDLNAENNKQREKSVGRPVKVPYSVFLSCCWSLDRKGDQDACEKPKGGEEQDRRE